MFDTPKFIFWPVGTGDSTSVVIKEDVVLQVDIRDIGKDDADDDHVSLIDKLVESLPEKDGNPYLSCFALTHPDKDHIQGFEDLLDRVTIGEIWFTPRVFKETDIDLCDDAISFKVEAERRVEHAINNGGDANSGDKVRIIGYDSILEDEDYKGFPEDRLTVPGNSIIEVDGEDLDGEFNAFIHAPFKEEEDGDRNNTSLAMQVVLGDDPSAGGVLLFGDIAYPRIRKIFDNTKENSNEDYLAWKVFLAPHHCSKSAMYHNEDGEEKLKQDMLDDLAEFQVDGGFIVASCEAIPSENKKGDNPPHAIAKQRYEEVAEGKFLCTHEDSADNEPLVFDVEENQITFTEEVQSLDSEDNISSAVSMARGSDDAPGDKVGFGFE